MLHINHHFTNYLRSYIAWRSYRMYLKSVSWPIGYCPKDEMLNLKSKRILLDIATRNLLVAA